MLVNDLRRWPWLTNDLMSTATAYAATASADLIPAGQTLPFTVDVTDPVGSLQGSR